MELSDAFPLLEKLAPVRTRPGTTALTTRPPSTTTTSFAEDFTRPTTTCEFSGKELISEFPEGLWRFGTVEIPDIGGKPWPNDSLARGHGLADKRKKIPHRTCGSRPRTNGSRRALHALQDKNFVKTHAYLRRSVSALLIETKEKDHTVDRLESAILKSGTRIIPVVATETKLMTHFRQDVMNISRIQRVANIISQTYISRPKLLANNQWVLNELWDLCEWCTSYWVEDTRPFEECIYCTEKAQTISKLTERIHDTIHDSLVEVSRLRDELTEAYFIVERLERDSGVSDEKKEIANGELQADKEPVRYAALRRINASELETLSAAAEAGNNHEFYEPLRHLNEPVMKLVMECVEEKVRCILAMDPKHFNPRRVYGFVQMHEKMCKLDKEFADIRAAKIAEIRKLELENYSPAKVPAAEEVRQLRVNSFDAQEASRKNDLEAQVEDLQRSMKQMVADNERELEIVLRQFELKVEEVQQRMVEQEEELRGQFTGELDEKEKVLIALTAQLAMYEETANADAQEAGKGAQMESEMRSLRHACEQSQEEGDRLRGEIVELNQRLADIERDETPMPEPGPRQAEGRPSVSLAEQAGVMHSMLNETMGRMKDVFAREMNNRLSTQLDELPGHGTSAPDAKSNARRPAPVRGGGRANAPQHTPGRPGPVDAGDRGGSARPIPDSHGPERGRNRTDKAPRPLEPHGPARGAGVAPNTPGQLARGGDHADAVPRATDQRRLWSGDACADAPPNTPGQLARGADAVQTTPGQLARGADAAQTTPGQLVRGADAAPTTPGQQVRGAAAPPNTSGRLARGADAAPIMPGQQVRGAGASQNTPGQLARGAGSAPDTPGQLARGGDRAAPAPHAADPHRRLSGDARADAALPTSDFRCSVRGDYSAEPDCLLAGSSAPERGGGSAFSRQPSYQPSHETSRQMAGQSASEQGMADGGGMQMPDGYAQEQSYDVDEFGEAGLSEHKNQYTVLENMFQTMVDEVASLKQRVRRAEMAAAHAREETARSLAALAEATLLLESKPAPVVAAPAMPLTLTEAVREVPSDDVNAQVVDLQKNLDAKTGEVQKLLVLVEELRMRIVEMSALCQGGSVDIQKVMEKVGLNGLARAKGKKQVTKVFVRLWDDAKQRLQQREDLLRFRSAALETAVFRRAYTSGLKEMFIGSFSWDVDSTATDVQVNLDLILDQFEYQSLPKPTEAPRVDQILRYITKSAIDHTAMLGAAPGRNPNENYSRPLTRQAKVPVIDDKPLEMFSKHLKLESMEEKMEKFKVENEELRRALSKRKLPGAFGQYMDSIRDSAEVKSIMSVTQ